MEQKPKTKRLTLDVPEEFHQKIKYEAIFVNVTLRKYVIRAILEKIQRDKKFRE
jgi:predicted HicB family RNase H-like nuclease